MDHSNEKLHKQIDADILTEKVDEVYKNIEAIRKTAEEQCEPTASKFILKTEPISFRLYLT